MDEPIRHIQTLEARARSLREEAHSIEAVISWARQLHTENRSLQCRLDIIAKARAALDGDVYDESM